MWFGGQKFTRQEIASVGTTIQKKHLWEKETQALSRSALTTCLHQQQPVFPVTQCGSVTLSGGSLPLGRINTFLTLNGISRPTDFPATLLEALMS
jgi:hypothetical protein